MITISLNKDEVDFVRALAKEAEIGGKSNVHRDHGFRMDRLSEDQFYGQLGEAALHSYWYGHLIEYARSRWYRNRMPYTGDGGSDINPLNVDVKCSKYRYEHKQPSDYNLIVRPKERHADWIYILALAKLLDDGSADIILAGWATDDMLPREPEEEGEVFAGAFVLPARDLKELMPLKTLWIVTS